jgi:hypothetical protein
MEEESAKWNMAPKNMPEERVPAGDDDEDEAGNCGDYNMDDYYEIKVEEGHDKDDNDDEDVLDLD